MTTADPRPRLLLLDGHSLAYRAFYALPVENFSTSTGQPTNAVYGFVSMLINTLRDEAPSHLAVAWDVSRQTFRSEAFPEYKANRSATPEEFRPQVPLVCEVLDAMGITSVRREGFEADDLIATLATRATEAGYQVLVLTGDRDALQLVNDDVTVLYPRKGVSDLVRYTPAAVEEKYGLTPRQYPDFAALRGDPSDNLPGIPGVGEKTATKWIREFGSFDALVERVEEVRGKVGESLRANLAGVIRNRTLTELVRDVELGVDVADLRLRPWESERVEEIFDTLQFRVLRDRLRALPGLGGSDTSTDVADDGGFQVEGQVLAPGQLAGWLAENAAGPQPVGVAVAGWWRGGRGEVDAIALATADPSAAAWLDPAELDAAEEAVLADWLADADRPKVLHEAKGAMLAFAARGWTVAGLVCDTALAAYLVLPGQRSLDLADLSQRFLQRELRPQGATEGQLTLDGVEEDEAQTLMVRARAVVDLAGVLADRLAEQDGERLLREVELELTPVLAALERTGIATDRDYLAQLEAEFGAEVKRVEQEAHRLVGREFNLGSPKQLQQILFEELGLPKTKKIKTGYTTDADALTWLATKTEHELPLALMRFRDAAKLRVTVEGLLKAIADDGRIHTTLQQTVAATGRLSSVDPNLQNIPVRTAEGRQIREAFVVGEGFEALLTADYSQIEMRIMAHLSEDEALLAAFASGTDFHTATASRVFKVAESEVTAEQRRRMKAMNYGLAYGLSAYGLSGQLGISADEARGLMDEYFERFGGVRDYLNQVVERARKTGYTETVLGRRRYLPDLNSDNRQRREMAERMALNAPIQGSSADIIKVAMINLCRALAESGLRSRLLLQVHDELIVEVAPGEREQVERLVRDRMSQAYPLRVELEVSVGVGRTWGAAAH